MRSDGTERTDRSEHSRAEATGLAGVRKCAASKELQDICKNMEGRQGAKPELRRDTGRQEHKAERDRNKQCMAWEGACEKHQPVTAWRKAQKI